MRGRGEICTLINELLYEHGQVVVPGLGTFYTLENHSFIDHVQGIIYPPSKDLHFRDSFDDKDLQLINCLSKNFEVSNKDAEMDLAVMSNGIRFELLDRGMVELENLGKLFYDEQKSLRLIPFPINFGFDSFGFGELKYYPVQRDRSHVKAAVIETQAAESGQTLSSFSRPSRSRSLLRKLPYFLVCLLAIGWMIFGLSVSKDNDFSKSYGPVQTKLNVSPVEFENRTRLEESKNPGSSNAQEMQEEQPKVESRLLVNRALIICYSFAEESNVKRAINKLQGLGYEVYSDIENGLTRVGANLSYSNNNDFQEAFNKLKKETTSKAVILSK